MTVRVGIIGSGFAASLHAQGLRQAPDAEIVAAASPNAEQLAMNLKGIFLGQDRRIVG